METKSKVVVGTSVILSLVVGVVGTYLVLTNNPQVANNVVRDTSTVQIKDEGISTAVDKIYDAVVVVTAYKNGSQISSGTGFVYKKTDQTGYLMTNNHVISGADEVKIIFSNNSVVDAKIVGSELYSDIAILSVPADKILLVASIGSSDDIRLGDTAFTVGAPLGIEYSGTVTRGIISGKDRLVEVSMNGSTSDWLVETIQTDAAINPGNSGGPLVNANGEVVGITSLKLVQSEVEGMGFAIPIEDALSYAETLETGGTIKRPFVGISMADVSAYAYYYQINTPEGVVISSVVDGSPASTAGLKKGDIVIAINDVETTNMARFRYELYKHQPGETITIKYKRDGVENTIKVTLTENTG
ncbi:MAG: trypsin-like peptidase domain-containing protein [bacterium]|nr:trypsin-like peptidase domain-containing protein [bacterium]